jgi:hypothetical protein
LSNYEANHFRKIHQTNLTFQGMWIYVILGVSQALIVPFVKLSRLQVALATGNILVGWASCPSKQCKLKAQQLSHFH